MKILSVDLETFSEVDIKKAGLYKYAQNSEILLFAYAFDDEPVHVVDFAQGEELPLDVMAALTDPDVLKTAYNATFEIHVINNWLMTLPDFEIMQDLGEYPLDPNQWFCTMIQGWTLGLAGGLDKVGKVLNLAEDKKKLATGKRLIQYFSKPCKPTKANGGRTRNLPEHAPEKWQMFKEYCGQDVEAERAIRKRIEGFFPNETERKLWCLDEEINDRGVMVDMPLVEAAIRIDEAIKEQTMQEARNLTGLDNPNSNTQVMGWFEQQEGWRPKTLDKEARAELMEQIENPEVRHMLRLKDLLGKTSVKKYIAMKEALCIDGRLHGMLQFYGASRTGRWSGRIVQLQNLPQNHLDDLNIARHFVRNGDLDSLQMFYDNPADVLSQLIRTAFIAAPGHHFIVADFSAIEARIIAWIADEKWVMDAFAKGEDIYCATASAMFHVPVVKHGENGHLRQKGKIATLACGYGGGVNALLAFGADKMGLSDADMGTIVKKWRKASSHIVKMWSDVEACFKKALRLKTTVKYKKGVEFSYEKGLMFMRLPSGRRIAYVKPRIEFEEKFNRETLTYEGLIQATGTWGRKYTWGGKLTENCLAEGTLVITTRGLVPIEDVKLSDLVWDGQEMVKHKGVICQGTQSVLKVDDFYMTATHAVMTKRGWQFAKYADRYDWDEVPLPNGFMPCRRHQARKSSMALPMCMREPCESGGKRFTSEKASSKILRLQNQGANPCGKNEARYVKAPGMGGMALNETEMHRTNTQGVEKLWRKGHNRMRPLDKQFRGVLGRYGCDLSTRAGLGQNRQRERLQPGKLQMDYPENQQSEQALLSNCGFTNRENDCSRIIRKNWNRSNDHFLQTETQMADRIAVSETGLEKQVYDIRDCGPRHQFAIWDPVAQKARIVHNCVQATARDCLGEAMLRLAQNGYRIVMHIHDEVVLEMPFGTGSLEEACAIMGEPIGWAPGLLLTADGYETDETANYYRKD